MAPNRYTSESWGARLELAWRDRNPYNAVVAGPHYARSGALASDTLSQIPFDNIEFVFVSRDRAKNAHKWLREAHAEIIHEQGCNCKGEGNG